MLLEADGERVTGTHAFVFNLPRYALGLPLAPEARDDDGLVNWVVFERPGLRNLLRYLWATARRRHLLRSNVRHGTAARLRITSQQPLPVQVDGEPAGLDAGGGGRGARGAARDRDASFLNAA